MGARAPRRRRRSILGRSTVWGCPIYPRLEANCRHCRRVQQPRAPATARHQAGPTRAAVVTLCPRCRSGAWGSIYRAKGFGLGSGRSEEHTSELQSLVRHSYAVFCLKKKKIEHKIREIEQSTTSKL